MKPPPSGKPLLERLQVRGGRRLAVLHAPEGLDSLFVLSASTRSPKSPSTRTIRRCV
jgi:hypothetical protein